MFMWSDPVEWFSTWATVRLLVFIPNLLIVLNTLLVLAFNKVCECVCVCVSKGLLIFEQCSEWLTALLKRFNQFFLNTEAGAVPGAEPCPCTFTGGGERGEVEVREHRHATVLYNALMVRWWSDCVTEWLPESPPAQRHSGDVHVIKVSVSSFWPGHKHAFLTELVMHRWFTAEMTHTCTALIGYSYWCHWELDGISPKNQRKS